MGSVKKRRPTAYGVVDQTVIIPLVGYTSRDGKRMPGDARQFIRIDVDAGKHSSEASFIKNGKVCAVFVFSTESLQMMEYAPQGVNVMHHRTVEMNQHLKMRSEIVDSRKRTQLTPVTKDGRFVGFELTMPEKHPKFKACFGYDARPPARGKSKLTKGELRRSLAFGRHKDGVLVTPCGKIVVDQARLDLARVSPRSAGRSPRQSLFSAQGNSSTSLM